MALSLMITLALRATVPENTLMLRWLTVLTLFMASGIVWSRIGLFQVNQFLIATGLPLFLLFSTIQSKLVNIDLIHDGSYYNPRYFLIGLCFLPFVIYDIRQRKELMVSALVNLSILVFYDEIHRLFGADAVSIMGHQIDNSFFVSVASSSAGFAIIAGMLILKSANARYEDRIETLLDRTREQNEELNAGIRYAQRLQEAVLPMDELNSTLSERTAVFLRPRDLLSGDFVFAADVNGYAYISVVDCTGHGVPGAFVSLMAHRALSDAAVQVGHEGPASVLDVVQQHITERFQQGPSGKVQDGMDLSLCAVHEELQQVHWASARGLAWLYTQNELVPLKAERRSIGDGSDVPFEIRSISYEKGDVLVMTSDGFPDQFGGPNTKKFGRKRFRALIEELASVDASVWHSRLEHRFSEWRGEEEQIDDVCVVFVRL